jgi:chemotaxis protein methyltransferase CheR
MSAGDRDGMRRLARVAGIQLSGYRKAHVEERLRRAVVREGVADAHELALLLERDEEARSRFRRSIAISVSGLFRDPQQFELLERELLPALVAGGGRIRVWSAGCADGSELYSVALVLRRLGVLERASLLGSELLEENLSWARRGVYAGVGVAAGLGGRGRFEQRDLLVDGAPPGKWKLVLCRNVAIYFVPEAKQALHELLAGCLAGGGLLMLGRSERIANPRSIGLEQAAPHVYRSTS